MVSKSWELFSFASMTFSMMETGFTALLKPTQDLTVQGDLFVQH